jgi:hypothetical protein
MPRHKTEVAVSRIERSWPLVRMGCAVLFVLAVLLVPVECATVVTSVHRAQEILAQEKANAESTQAKLTVMLTARPPRIREAQDLLLARQEALVRASNAALVDKALQQPERVKVTETFESEGATLLKQALMLEKARQIAP